MIESIKIVNLQSNDKKIFNIITDNKNYFWRKDISKIEVIDDFNFIEYDKNGFKTKFRITNIIPNERYELNFKNDNIKGHFFAKLKKVDLEMVELKLIEQVEVSNIIMKLFAKSYLKRQQKNYVKNLKVELKNR